MIMKKIYTDANGATVNIEALAQATSKRRKINRPTAIREAMKIAKEASGRRLDYDWVWINKNIGTENSYRVEYKLPGVEGRFVCKQLLFLTEDEYDEYYDWEWEQPSADTI